MKRYTTYTKLELSKVSEEELQNLIDLEIAYAGITPVPCPNPLPPFDPGIEACVQAYEVCGNLVMTLKDAEKIAAIDIYASDYDYYTGVGSKYSYLTEKYENKTIKKVAFYKKEDVKKVKSMIEDYSERKKAHDEEEKAWNKYQESISEIRTNVYAAFRDARDFYSKVEFAKTQYQRFLALSEGNTSIAARFFCDAYQNQREVINAISEWLTPEQAESMLELLAKDDKKPEEQA